MADERSGDDLKMEVAVSQTKVEKLPVMGEDFFNCSDHFGISTVIM
jgi:hypothetical protein